MPPPPSTHSDKVIEGIPAEMPTAEDPLGIPDLPDAPAERNADGTRKAPIDPNSYIEDTSKQLTPEQREAEIQKLLDQYVGDQTDDDRKARRKFDIDFNKRKKNPLTDEQLKAEESEDKKVEQAKTAAGLQGKNAAGSANGEEGKAPENDPRLEPERSRRHNYKTYIMPEIFRNTSHDRANRTLPNAMYEEDLYEYLYAAAYRNNLNGIRALLGKGLNPNATARNGFTPLMAAAQSGQMDAERLLLLSGADPNLQNRDGMSALHVAASSGSPASVKILLHMGANPRVATRSGVTPLDMAQRVGRSDIVALLQQALPAAPAMGWPSADAVRVSPLVAPRRMPGESTLPAQPEIDYGTDNPLPWPPVPFSKPHYPPLSRQTLAVMNQPRPQPVIVAPRPVQAAIAPVPMPQTSAPQTSARQAPAPVRVQAYRAIPPVTAPVRPPQPASVRTLPVLTVPHPAAYAAVPAIPTRTIAARTLPEPPATRPMPALEVPAYREKEPARPAPAQTASLHNQPSPAASPQTAAEPLMPENRALPASAYREVPVMRPYTELAPSEQKLWLDRLKDWQEADRLFSTLTFEEKVEYNYRRKVLEQVFPDHFRATNATDRLLMDRNLKRWTDFDRELRIRLIRQSQQTGVPVPSTVLQAPTAAPRQPAPTPSGQPLKAIISDAPARVTPMPPSRAAVSHPAYPAMAQQAYNEMTGAGGNVGLSETERLHEILENWRIIDSRFATMDHEQKRRADEQRRRLLDLLAIDSATGTYARSFAALPKEGVDKFIASQMKWEAFEDSERAKYPDYAILVRPWGGEVATDPLSTSSADTAKQYPSFQRTESRLRESMKQAGK